MRILTVLLAILLGTRTFCLAQNATGTVKGTVSLAATGDRLHHAHVFLSPLGKSVETGMDGSYTFAALTPGRYTVVARMNALSDERQVVEVGAGETATADFSLKIAQVKDSVTVTATEREVSTLDTLQSITTLDSAQLQTASGSTSLGDSLQNEPGMAKRSFGPGSTRPVIRGFDGDRVLVMQDGIRTGALSSQSGDHGEPVDVNSIERIEVVKGPATLLYGSNAIGGVVNILTGHHVLNQHPHDGVHGSVTAVGGTANAQGGISGRFEAGFAKDWLVYGEGGYLRMGEYNTPAGRVLNSQTDMTTSLLGIGRYGEKFAWTANFGYQQGIYGIPVPSEEQAEELGLDAGEEEPVQLQWDRKNFRVQTITKELGKGLDTFSLGFNYSAWNHKELEGETVGTEFFNNQYVYRGVFQQKTMGKLSGSFGFWGMHRDYEAVGDEALTPPVTQNAFALFGLEELKFEKLKLQFGARLETNHYNPLVREGRSFTGLSASAGALWDTWKNGAMVVNYIHSFRAPALEELYAFGPHFGNVAFEVGDSGLQAEVGNGLEYIIRHSGKRVRSEYSLFGYYLHDFVYMQPNGEYRDGLPVYFYRQNNARFIGADAKTDVKLHEELWLKLGFGYVDANLTGGENLPRIPPARGTIGLDWFWRGLSIKPELVLANKQWQVAPLETSTAGYVTGNLTVAYTITQTHVMHQFSANTFNLGDALYRNHLSFIKAYAPEIGRGIRFGYTMNFF